jgi:hypothetical protein
LESLESKIGYWKQYRSKAVNRLIREYLTDTTIIYHNDSLIALFQNEPELESKYMLAFTYWENNQPDEAMDVLNDIPSIFGLTSVDLDIYNQYLDYFDILKMMKDSNINARQLDSSSVHSLLNIMDANLPIISAYARGLLLKGRHIKYTETVNFPMESKHYPAYYFLDPKKLEFDEDNHLFLFPNPCGDYIIAYFNTLDLGQNGELIIYNLHGQKLNRIKLNSMQNQQVINLLSYSDGIYLIGLFENNKLLSVQKFSKARK